jgi:hypothetical protein
MICIDAGSQQEDFEELMRQLASRGAQSIELSQVRF